jgi:phage tail-like protein
MPIAAARFSITVDGYEIASFSELQGITTEVTPVEHARLALNRLALQSTTTRDRRSKTFSFVHPKSTDLKLLSWHRAGTGRLPNAYKNAVLNLYAEDSGSQAKPVARYHLEAAWPSAIEPQAPTSGNSVAIEKITIAYEHIDRI